MNAVSVRAFTMKMFWVPTNQEQLKVIVWIKKFVPDNKKHASYDHLMT